MLVSKFPYQQLTRESINDKRYYSDPNGNKLSSVTTILEATHSEETKNALKNWRNRVGEAEAIKIAENAALRGEFMHSFLEEYILNDKIEMPLGNNPFSMKKQSYKMAQCIVQNGLKNVDEFYGSEISLYYPELYAGSTDGVALYEGELIIFDFKQANKLKKETYLDSYRCQILGYILAHNELYGTNIKRGINMICTQFYEYQQFEINKDNYNKYEDMWWNKLEQYYKMEQENGK